MSEWNFGLVYAVISISFGSGFQHGYHTGVTNIPHKTFKTWIKAVYSDRYGATPSENSIMVKWTVIVAVYAMGGIVGGALTSVFADRCGRKSSLMWNNLVALIGCLICATSKQIHRYHVLILGRFVVGINAGLNGGICQIYLMEIAPRNIRGMVGGVYQLMIVIGILGAQIVGFLLGNDEYWPSIFLVPLLPSLIQIITLPFCPESPMYLLIVKGDETQTEKSLKFLRKPNQVDEELKAIIQNDNLIKELRLINLKRLCTNAVTRKNILVCITLMMGQQLCGINVVTYYSSDSFSRAGIREINIMYIMSGLGMVVLLTTIGGILTVDSFGRRKLLLSGFLGLALTTVALTVMIIIGHYRDYCKYAHIFLYYLFAVFFAPGLGVVPWFYTAEVFYPTASSLAVSIAVPVNWISNVIVAQTFLPLIAVVGFYVYLVFITMDVFFFICLYIHMPETAKKSMDEIIRFYT